MPTDTNEAPWEVVEQLVASRDAAGLSDYLDDLGPSETARAISRLDETCRNDLLILLDPRDAAEVIEDVSDAQAVELIEDLPADRAASIVDQMPSDEQADLLGDLDEEDAEEILREMTPDEARTVRVLMTYEPDSAGGIMVTEYLRYGQNATVEDVTRDLAQHREQYARYDIQYIYVIDDASRLVGVLPLRELLFAPHAAPLRELMITDPLSVPATASLEDLENFFDQYDLFGVSVVDAGRQLVGVVLRSDVEEAAADRTTRQVLGLSGIVGGEELRSMPVMVRSGRRLSWLSINVVLNLVAAGVIAAYQDTLEAAIALAVFLPMISDMSGCSGNQAVAVSMRELTLGLIRPNELLRVMLKEASVGLINGIALGLLLGGLAMLWKSNPWLGVVVGGALAVNTVVAVTMGGLLPLLLKRLRLDPALVSGPILTTITDMCGFFIVLSMATTMIEKL